MKDHDARSIPEPAGGFVTLDGEPYYRISEYDLMPPFLMNIPSHTDLWMFVSSAGGLTAGKVDADGSLFTYETVDRLHDGHHHTGPITLIRIPGATGRNVLWRPFMEERRDDLPVERNIYKNLTGGSLVFEEIRRDLSLSFRYRWSASDDLGFVRTATLANLGRGRIAVQVMDGLRNVLPYGVPLALYQQSSSLVDAYKRTDLDPETRLAIFSLTSRIIDRAEASEELRANAVWCRGLGECTVCLSLDAVAAFRRGEPVAEEEILTGRRGNYLVVATLELEPGAQVKWHIVADVGLSHVQLTSLRAWLLEGGDIDRVIEDRLRKANDDLLRIVGSADGLQLTGDAPAAAHHLASVLFNNMRGGVFGEGYDIPAADLRDFIRRRNRPSAARHERFLASLPEKVTVAELQSFAGSTNDPNLQRLCLEYLPIYFGRRHGDPSRPWNRFSIRVKNRDGSRVLRYEGNWRDIFQNWEALSASFPGFLPSVIVKFVNASTMDGFNPYRITRDGIDWEVVDPKDPWSHIGYWGDHQIIYLLKFLEALRRFSPGALEAMLGREMFCYADVPYRIKPYAKLLEDPNSTIVYDTDRAARIEARVREMGSDGKLVPDADGAVYHVSLLEKLLVPVLSKLSNLVADGGIWMNTQRPEWNDANNALVGSGVSMVTLCYLRRHLRFLADLLDGAADSTIPVSVEVVGWFGHLRSILDRHRPLLDAELIDDVDRKRLLDSLGEAFSEYRDKVYAGGFAAKQMFSVREAAGFCRMALGYLDHAIRANRRKDGLYHSYNLLDIAVKGKRVSIRPLYEMLEGQVAVLSSGALDAEEAVTLLSALFTSGMYRADQRSFLLYPERVLPRFLERNRLTAERVSAIPLLRGLLEAGERSILERDAMGTYRFHADFKNALDLESALDRLAEQGGWAEQIAKDKKAVFDLFEDVFHHRSFTGRSGTMYGYEGLGCIYWHMVAKLLLAVQEVALRAVQERKPASVVEELTEFYYRIRGGLGFEKTAKEYGAFPTDPYSHTPPHGGAQQPGMTGQVKEEILTRWGELGVIVENGVVSFRPALLRRAEFLREPGTFLFYDLDGQPRSVEVPAGGLAFTFCQVPIIYRLTRGEAWIRAAGKDGSLFDHRGHALDTAMSRALFNRLGVIRSIEVGIPDPLLKK
jgi:hypothetical protein